MRYILVLFLGLSLAGCATAPTVFGHFEKREKKLPVISWFQSDYIMIPECYVKGGPGKIRRIEKPDGTKETEVIREKGPAVIDLGILADKADYRKTD